LMHRGCKFRGVRGSNVSNVSNVSEVGEGGIGFPSLFSFGFLFLWFIILLK
jgi:hypothetical protein